MRGNAKEKGFTFSRASEFMILYLIELFRLDVIRCKGFFDALLTISVRTFRIIRNLNP